MKRIILLALLALLLLPELAHSQFRAKCFNLNLDDTSTQTRIGIDVNRDTTIAFSAKAPIYGFSVSGQTTLGNDNDSYVRITLKDSYNYEHLVYECFPLLADSLSMQFQNVAMETMALDGVVPQCMEIVIKNATVRLASYQMATKGTDTRQKMLYLPTVLKAQNQYIADKLNGNLEKHNMTWRAGVTSVSQTTYEEKKAMFGGKVPLLYGFEYYKGGIFVMPEEETGQKKISMKSAASNQYVSEWDWRNRHGKNWMTTVKNQENCYSCGAFSALGALEAYINLYYNQLLDYDLSEEELISCISSFTCNNGMTQGTAFDYIENNGIVEETCFPYTAQVQNCENKCQVPSEMIAMDNHCNFSNTAGENFIKEHLFRAPLPFGITPWNHALVLAGYKTIEVGDTINNGNVDYPYYRVIINQQQHFSLIGKTAWLLKNSWNTDWGNNGYAYVIVDISNLNWLYYIEGSIHSSNYTDLNISCEDADGDGYYFWGIGPKPTSCPSWVPDTPDGDDSNINLGAMDEYGNLENLPPGITINTPTEYSSATTISNRIGIVKNGSLTISGSTTMQGSGNIRVCEGGVLIVDGCTLTNASLDLIPGCTVIIRNNGQIQMASGKEFKAPLGVVVQMESGKISPP